MTPTTTRAVLTAYGRALKSQFTGKMMLLSIIPFLLSLIVWAVVLHQGFQPLVDYVQRLFEEHGGFAVSGNVLATFGLGVLKTMVVPLIAMLVLLPLMILSALLVMGLVAMPAIGRHVSQRQYPDLERKRGGSLLGSLATNATGFLIFVGVWLLTVPLYLFAPIAVVVQIALWGWLTARVMTYDALAEHASVEERAIIARTHRMPLLAIGMVSGLCGALPGIVWIGGSIVAFFMFPFLVAISIWIYLLIFIFTGLWFQYYCLHALAELRAGQADAAVAILTEPDA